MANYYYNGVLGPELPVEMVRTYYGMGRPCLTLLKNNSDGYYYLFNSNGIPYYDEESFAWPVIVFGNGSKYEYCYYLHTKVDNPGTWSQGGISEPVFVIDDDLYSVIWSSHDIRVGSPGGTEIYLEGSKPVPADDSHTHDYVNGVCGYCFDVDSTHVHNYVETVLAPVTCTTNGQSLFVCACGDSYVEEILATGHSYENDLCTVCGELDPNHTHDYVESVYQAATCTSEGIKRYTCSCGYNYSDFIPATGHSYDDGVITTDPTCGKDGIKTYTCSSCGDAYTEVIPATGQHTYENGVCTVCGAVMPFTSDEIVSDADVNIEGVPDVPADILANYPHTVISEVTVNSNRYYVLVASVSEFYYVPKGVLMSSEIIGTLGNARAYTVKNGSWSQEAEYEAGTAYATIGNLGENTNADLVWSNHDIYIVDRANTSTGEYELGRVYFQNSEYTGDNGDFTVTHYYYNGVLLPEIPPDVLTEYPYCWIRENTQTGYYDLFLAKTPWYQSDASTISTDSYTQGIQWYRVPFTGTSGEWQSYQVWDSSSGLTSETGRKIIWANHNIPVGSATSTDIYFAGSSAIPNAESYEIQRETIVALADQVRRLYNSTAPLTPAQMEAKLANLNIELQEAHVSVSEEEQIIRPDVGYYGFSSITVEAFEMDDSGGTGPGIGGDTGDDPENPTDLEYAEDNVFGAEYAEDPKTHKWAVVRSGGNVWYVVTDGYYCVEEDTKTGELRFRGVGAFQFNTDPPYYVMYKPGFPLYGEWERGYNGAPTLSLTSLSDIVYTNDTIYYVDEFGKKTTDVAVAANADASIFDGTIPYVRCSYDDEYLVKGNTLYWLMLMGQQAFHIHSPMSLNDLRSKLAGLEVPPS